MGRAKKFVPPVSQTPLAWQQQVASAVNNIPELHSVTLEEYGGRADWNGTTGTDNYAALMKALDNKPDVSRNFAVEIVLGPGQYYFSQTVDLHVSCRIRGQTCGMDTASVAGLFATMMVWPADTTCIRIQNGDTDTDTTGDGPSAAGSFIERVCIAQATQGTDLNAHGIWLRAQATLDNVAFYQIAGNAIHNVAYGDGVGANRGNTSEWKVIDCIVYSCGGDGLHTNGYDANAGYAIGFKTKDCGGCGIYDTNTLGNTYVAPQITGYGGLNGHECGVHYAGRLYQLVASTEIGESLGSTTQPGTNGAVWRDIGSGSASATFPTWVNGTTYRFHAPVHVAGGSNRSILLGLYVEPGSTYVNVDPPACTFEGLHSATNTSSHYEGNTYFGNGFYAQRLAFAGTAHATAFGAYQYSGLNTGNPWNADYPPNILSHQREKDADQALFWGYYNNTDPNHYIYYANQRNMCWFTNKGTASTFGRSTAQPYYFVIPDVARYSNEDGTTRVDGIGSGPPGSGYHAQGEFIRNYAPTAAGTFGWVCVTSGTPGTWKAVGGIAA